jgi:hypothetical protein
MKNLSLALCLVASSALSGCSQEGTSTLAPSTTGGAALVGTWTSSNLASTANACTDFKWNVTQLTGNTASGTFSATCVGDLKVAGSANGTLSGSTVAWNAAATASVPGLPACPITLSGTAELGIDSIRVPYSGDTCLGKVSGVEVLKKN